ncbi:YybH family protein [Gemmatirosa kalamazoonensis]|uniref:YybH family protein n=1 Tax=Gemmatirosa kalamazoonensis TaxID=861299 RepID=UPI00130D8A28|nr:DUF4440 domain-containing protein [Gemmatirosa kalamazoonensis]
MTLCGGGCARGARVSTAPPTSTERAVRAAAAEWVRAAAERDGEAMGAYFAEDAFVMYPRPQPTVGRAANTAVWVTLFARPGALHPLTTDSVVVARSGDLAYVTGRWHLSAPAAGTQPATDVGAATWQCGAR